MIYTCQICKKKLKNIQALSQHIGKVHKNISKEDYYLKYISTTKKIVCNNEKCNNITKFLGFKLGYQEYCSKKCSTSSEETKKKFRKTCLEKFGVEYPIQSLEFKKKRKESNINKYGFSCTLQNKLINKKAKKTLFNNYGVKNPSSSLLILNRVKKTCKEKYGYDYAIQSKLVRDKLSKTKKTKSYMNLLHSDKLKNIIKCNFSLDEFNGYGKEYSWVCLLCGNVFNQVLYSFNIPICRKCFPYMKGTSYLEQEVYKFIIQYFSDSIEHDRTILSGKELDIFIPSKNLAIEFDGLYWHSELQGKDSLYHLDKTIACNSKNIQLLHIFEDEWVFKRKIVESILLSKIGVISNNIYARKCIIEKISRKEASNFLNNNHLQGYIKGTHLGLYHNDELVSILTYGKPRFNSNYDIEILRFCSKLNTIVVGGLSKLLKQINSNSIITYVDRRYGDGKSYNNIGFELIGETKPSYYYIKGTDLVRHNRMNFQKHKLKSKLESYDPNLTEWQNMQLNGYDRIWDCGNYVYSKE